MMVPCKLPAQTAAMANSLYHSLQGQYFVGYADNMFFERDKNAWAALANLPNSGVHLFVNVWTVSDLYEPPIRMQIWLNAALPGDYTGVQAGVPGQHSAISAAQTASPFVSGFQCGRCPARRDQNLCPADTSG